MRGLRRERPLPVEPRLLLARSERDEQAPVGVVRREHVRRDRLPLPRARDELELLVCGMGIQFAGPAANFALMYLTPGSHFFMSVMQYVGPLCTLGMLGLCFYAVRIPKAARARAREARRLGNAAVRRA